MPPTYDDDRGEAVLRQLLVLGAILPKPLGAGRLAAPAQAQAAGRQMQPLSWNSVLIRLKAQGVESQISTLLPVCSVTSGNYLSEFLLPHVLTLSQQLFPVFSLGKSMPLISKFWGNLLLLSTT